MARLLIIEDEKKLADSVVQQFQSADFAVDVAYDGTRGRWLALVEEYDLVILDLMLPDISGTEILKQVREQKPDMPILILTASGRAADKVYHFEAGADDYLTKPFAFAELLVRTRALLRRSETNSPHVLELGDLKLDRLRGTVNRAGKSIELTSKEYSLLEYLLSNAGRVLSRTMIIQHVWDESFEGLTNIVDVYMRHLRQKIDDPCPVKLLKTMRGAGYYISIE